MFAASVGAGRTNRFEIRAAVLDFAAQGADAVAGGENGLGVGGELFELGVADLEV